MNPSSADKALRELELELGLPVDDVTGMAIKDRRIEWSHVYEWCKAHPGVEWEVEPVYAQAVYRLNKRYPDLTVRGSNYRKEASGRRVARMFVVYQPNRPVA